MKGFGRRLRYYLIGLGMGLVFVFLIFGNRGCSWLPDNRVKNMVAEKDILYGDSIRALMSCLEISNTDIYALLKDEGDVIYDKSNTQSDPKEYFIEGEDEMGVYYAVTFALGEEFSEVLGMEKEGRECKVSGRNKNLQSLPYPDEDVIAILESKKFRIMEEAQLNMKELGIKDSDIENFHKTAKIRMDLSKPRLEPNAYYVLEGVIKGDSVHVKYEIGENRTRIRAVKSLEDPNYTIDQIQGF